MAPCIRRGTSISASSFAGIAGRMASTTAGAPGRGQDCTASWRRAIGTGAGLARDPRSAGKSTVAIEMLLTTAERVRTTGRAPPDYAVKGSMATGFA